MLDFIELNKYFFNLLFNLREFYTCKRIFNKFYLFKSPKNLSKSLEYIKFTGMKTLNQKYKTKINLNLNLRKDRITLYR